MKKILAILMMFVANIVLAQTFPVQNLTVAGTQNTVGVATFQTPIAVTSGGIGTGTAGGTALDNITAFASTGFLTRTGSNTYSFQSLTNGITLGNLAQAAANTILANVTGSTANVTAFAVPSCSTSASALNWTTNTGLTCNTAINAAQLGGATFAAPGPIGSTTASTGAFTALSASGSVTGTGFNNLFASPPNIGSVTPATGAFTTLTANTPAVGTNSTAVATSAFVAAHAPCYSILDNGGDNTGVSNNDTSWTATLGLGPTGKKCIFFPAGTYKFGANVSYTLPSAAASVSILGAGSDLTQLQWAGGGGITINVVPNASFHIRDLSLGTGTTATGNALLLTQSTGGGLAQSDISGVTIRGSDGYAVTDYWANGIDIVSVNNVNVINTAIFGASTAAGSGAIISGTGTAIPVQFNFVADQFANLSIGINYGAFTQGVTVNQSNFTGDNTGINVPASLTGLDQLNVMNSQFNDTGNAIIENTFVENTMIHGNLFLIPNAQSGIFLSQSGGFSITGNTFNNANGTHTTNNGVVIGNTQSNLPGVISGNFFTGMGGSAVLLQATSNNVSVQGNSYIGNGTPVTNSSGAACPPTTTQNCVGSATQ